MRLLDYLYCGISKEVKIPKSQYSKTFTWNNTKLFWVMEKKVLGVTEYNVAEVRTWQGNEENGRREIVARVIVPMSETQESCDWQKSTTKRLIYQLGLKNRTSVIKKRRKPLSFRQ